MSARMVKLSDVLRNAIGEALKPLRPEKVILFGSYAWGQPGEDSDIDLYAVTRDDFVPSTWRLEHGPLGVSPIVRQIEKEGVPL